LGEQAAVYVQDQLARVGVKMDILILDRSVASARFRAGDFEAAIWTNTGAGEGYPVVFGEGSPIGYANPTVIDLLKAIQATMNPDEHDRIYRKLWPIFQADLPITVIYPYVLSNVAHRRVRGLSTPYRPSPFHGIDDLWLEDDDKKSEEKNGKKK
jgi:ABC-type transport system substrate-binding protein